MRLPVASNECCHQLSYCPALSSLVLERGLARALRQELPSADAAPGERLGAFEMGSTVVLLYDAPEDWALEATEGAAVRMGQPLARQPPCK